MKLHTDGDRFGVETDPEDAALARATADTVRGLLDIADAAGLRADGACDHCGEDERLRPVPAANEAGEAVLLDVCAGCQVELAEQQIAANREDDAEPDPRHTRTGDVIEGADDADA